MKIQVKEMFETVGKDAQGKSVREKIGVMYCESIEGRVAELLQSFGEAAIAGFVDDQVLHHPASAAFKSKGKKGEAEGLDRLPYEPQDGRQLYRTPLSHMVKRDELIATFEKKIEDRLALEGDAEEIAKVVANARRRIAYFQSLPKVERPAGMTDEQLEETDVVRVNWAFRPGQSASALAKEAAIVKAIDTQLELLAMDGREITDELREKVSAFVRSKM